MLVKVLRKVEVCECCKGEGSEHTSPVEMSFRGRRFFWCSTICFEDDITRHVESDLFRSTYFTSSITDRQEEAEGDTDN